MAIFPTPPFLDKTLVRIMVQDPTSKQPAKEFAYDDAMINAMQFETALARLEEIVQKLESGEAKLEEAIDLYEAGVRLKAHCQKKLEAAEMRIERITKTNADPVSFKLEPGGIE